MEDVNSGEKKLVSVVLVEKPLEDVWEHWIRSASIKQWNIPFDDWHCPEVENDFREGGQFNFRMERRIDHEGFDYVGIYECIIPFEYIESISGGRSCIVEFQAIDHNTIIRETFEPDTVTPLDLQQNFTDAVLLSFKKFVESR
ncbi:SRPBCC domain-containing protein [Sphingobacterium sp. CZ-UAM]|uniref:SRPBCC domain-containing protein n=1 Tax=Sphingobacterium sp. CZ-UAM TaxID=1933868 RepID=UPI0009843C98|nr:SRPBCC domain-containing protein [Sphingobacterium sp. CZ-UAM]